MATWPAISEPDYGLSEELYFPIVRTEFDSNYIHVRKRTTRARRRWDLSWNNLTDNDYDLLETFFLANQGVAFTWTHPLSLINYTVVFSGNSLKSSIPVFGYRNVAVAIEEI